MRNHQLGIAFALGIVASFLPAAAAQTKQPFSPSTAATADQRRDLSGVWFDDRPRPVTTNERYWIYKFNTEEPPMTSFVE